MIKLIIAGYKSDKFHHNKIKKKYSKQWLSKHIKYLDFLDYRQIEEQISKSFLGLCILKPFSYSYSATIPNKLIDYMAGGIINITTSNVKESRNIVQNAKSGILVDYYKPNSLFSCSIKFYLLYRDTAVHQTY